MQRGSSFSRWKLLEIVFPSLSVGAEVGPGPDLSSQLQSCPTTTTSSAMTAPTTAQTHRFSYTNFYRSYCNFAVIKKSLAKSLVKMHDN